MFWTDTFATSPNRNFHAAVVVGSNIYAFAKVKDRGPRHTVDYSIDIYVLDTKSMVWTEIDRPKGEFDPVHRIGYSVVAHNGYIYLWGGRKMSGCRTCVHRFDPTERSWSIIKAGGRIPRMRLGYSVFMYKDRMYVCGITEPVLDHSPQVVLCYLDFSSWTWITVETERVLNSCSFESAFVLNEKMYMIQKDEVDCLDLQTNRWETLKVNGESPEEAQRGRLFVYGNHAYVFHRRRRTLDEVYRFDPVLCEWQLVNLYGNPPKFYWSTICVLVGDRMFMFGENQIGTKMLCLKMSLTLLVENRIRSHELDISPLIKDLIERNSEIFPKVEEPRVVEGSSPPSNGCLSCTFSRQLISMLRNREDFHLNSKFSISLNLFD